MRDPHTYTLPAYVIPPIVRETRVTDMTMPARDWRMYDRPAIERMPAKRQPTVTPIRRAS